jgi:hypothetical protein
MYIAYVDLRHGTPTGFLHHFVTQLRLQINPDFMNIGHALAQQQALGIVAIGANGTAVHGDFSHVKCSLF